VQHLEHSFVWCWNLDTSESRSETPAKFLNVVLEKISWTDRVRNEEVFTKSQGGEEYTTYNKKKKG
jgi:hypothetical protein